MLKPYFNIWMFSVAMMVLGVGVVSAQNYPIKPIRLVTSAIGGNADFSSRLIAQELSVSLGQQTIVDNRGGIAEGNVLKAPPDGYTLLLYGAATWLMPLLQSNVPYDPVRDFSPITLPGSTPNVIAVHPSVLANSVKELVALVKARPGELNYASGPSGSSTHLSPELFKVMAGVNIVRIPYKGTGAAISDLIGGQVQMSFASPASLMPHVKLGKLRALAVTSAQPSALLPGLPTVAASGVPGYESIAIYGIFAPAKTPKAIIDRLNQEIVRFLNRPDMKEKFLTVGVEVVGSSPEQLAAVMKSEIAKWGKIIKDAGIRAD